MTVTEISSIMVDGLKFYRIPKSYLLYRGDTYMPSSKPLSQGPCFFALDAESAGKYGMVYEFKTTADVDVLALDDKLTMKTLYENAPEHIQKILEKNYGFLNNKRDSHNTADKQLSQYLCNKGYAGYALLEKMGTDMGGKFHKEMMFCAPNVVVKVQKQITDEKLRTTYINEDKARKAAEIVREKRAEDQRRQKEENSNKSSDSPNKKLFGSPSSYSYNTPSSSPIKSSYKTNRLFDSPTGGKKSRRSTKTFRKTVRKIETKERQK